MLGSTEWSFTVLIFLFSMFIEVFKYLILPTLFKNHVTALVQNSDYCHAWNFVNKIKMCHNFILPGVLILRFANILEIPLIWENRNLLNHSGYNMAKKLFLPFQHSGHFLDGKYVVVKILWNIIFKRNTFLYNFFFSLYNILMSPRGHFQSKLHLGRWRVALICSCCHQKIYWEGRNTRQ